MSLKTCALMTALSCAVAVGCVAPSHSLVPTKGKSLLLTRAFLVGGYREAWGYGAYSYVLLPAEPSSDERYVALLTAYLARPADAPVHPDGQITPQSSRNITYAPVKERPPSEPPPVNWLVHSYDVSRAAALLHARGLYGRGPYIVTSDVPLSAAPARSEIAVLDLSSVSADSMKAWFDYFARASAGPNEWAGRGAELVLLKLHDLLLDLGVAGILTIRAIEPAGKIAEAFSAAR
jgi:hypothetical protein